MAQFICEKQGRCCPHEFYNSIEDAISDSEDGVPCDHLVEVSPVRHGRWEDNRDENGALCNKWRKCSSCGYLNYSKKPNYCPNCGAKMDGGDDNAAD